MRVSAAAIHRGCERDCTVRLLDPRTLLLHSEVVVWCDPG